MTSTPIRLTAVIAAGVLVAGCGSSDSPSTPAKSSGTVTAPTSAVSSAAAPAAAGGAVTVKQFQFMPAELVVKAGTTVTWTNQDDILHTATSGATPGTPDGQFDGPMDGPGKSFSHTFGRPGRHPYFCNRHTSMTGTVVVE
jgi:plastocyanin